METSQQPNTSTQEPRQDTTCLLLHPLGSAHEFWDPVLSSAVISGSSHRFRALDLPGHGGEAILPGPGRIEALGDWLLERLEERPVAIVGMSLGGLIAQNVASRRPDLVSKLVLVATVARYPEPMVRLWESRALDVRAKSDVSHVIPAMEELWFTDDFRSSANEAVTTTRTVLRRTDPEGYAWASEALSAADTRSAASLIQSPTLVICGGQDAPAFREQAAWLAEHIQNSCLLWLPGKHAAILQDPDAFANLLVAFLSSDGF